MSEKSAAKFSRFPLFWLSLCFAVGILAGRNVSDSHGTFIVICLCATVGACVFPRHRLSALLAMVAFVAAGTIAFSLVQQGVPESRLRRIFDERRIESGEPLKVTGTLAGNPEASYDGTYVTIEAEKITYKSADLEASGRLRIFVPIQNPEMAADYKRLSLRRGSRIRAACDPVREESFQNPGVRSRKEILDWQSIDATASVKSPLLIENLSDGAAWNPLNLIFGIRQALIDRFRAIFSAKAAGVLIASLLGNRHFLDKESAEVFREGGTFHILVISGLHITFIGAFLLLLVRNFTSRKPVQFALVSSILWIYTIAVGAEVPVVRASLMFTMLLFSRVIYREGTLLNSLGACAVILLVWRPEDLFTPSFQLTFVSVAAIVIMGFPLIDKLRRIGDWTPTVIAPFPPHVPTVLLRLCETVYWNDDAWRIEAKRHVWSAKIIKSPYIRLRLGSTRRAVAFIFEGLLISIVVQVWLLPFLVIYFHRISLLSVPLNLWAGVLIATESFSALFSVCLSAIGDVFALPFIKLTEMFSWLLIAFPDVFVRNGWASFRLPAYTGWPGLIYAIYLLPVIVLGYAVFTWNPFAFPRAKRHRLGFRTTIGAASLWAALGAAVIFHPFSSPRPDGRFHIDFLDVGQGDAALLTFPDGRTMLIDGGGRINYGGDEKVFVPDVPGIGESVVSEFLWAKGYSHLDYILATHADADHIQGLDDVARNFSIGLAMFGRAPILDGEFAKFAEILRRRGIPSEMIGRGDAMDFGGVSLDVLWPDVSNDPNAASDNDHSVVLRVVMGTRVFLLTGDIEKGAESKVVADGRPLKADVVKVPHHGSRTSSTSEFVAAANARFAIISVGRRSVFGHPHKDVVERWRASGAEVMTTGESGTISVSTDGTDLTVTRFRPQE